MQWLGSAAFSVLHKVFAHHIGCFGSLEAAAQVLDFFALSVKNVVLLYHLSSYWNNHVTGTT